MPGAKCEKQAQGASGEHHTVPERNSGNKPTLLADAVVDCHIATVYRGIPLSRLLGAALPGSEDGKEGLQVVLERGRLFNEQVEETNSDIQLAEKAVPVLGSALKAVPREKPVGGKGEAYVGGFGDVEGCQGQLGAVWVESVVGFGQTAGEDMQHDTMRRIFEQGAERGSETRAKLPRTLSFFASRQTSSLNLNMQASASCSTATPSSLRVKFRTTILGAMLLHSVQRTSRCLGD